MIRCKKGTISSKHQPALLFFQDSLVQAGHDADGSPGDYGRPLTGDWLVHLGDREVAVEIPEGKVGGIHEVYDQGFGDIVR